MTAQEIAAIERAYPTREGTTHYDGCVTNHAGCAIWQLLKEVRRLQALVKAQRPA